MYVTGCYGIHYTYSLSIKLTCRNEKGSLLAGQCCFAPHYHHNASFFGLPLTIYFREKQVEVPKKPYKSKPTLTEFTTERMYSNERVSCVYDFRVGPVVILALLRQLVFAPGVFKLEQRLPRRHVLVVALLPLGVDDLRLPGLMGDAARVQEKSQLATIFPNTCS